MRRTIGVLVLGALMVAALPVGAKDEGAIRTAGDHTDPASRAGAERRALHRYRQAPPIGGVTSSSS